jgi:hypothetical protein
MIQPLNNVISATTEATLINLFIGSFSSFPMTMTLRWKSGVKMQAL